MQLSRLELLSRSYPGTDHATVLRGISCIMVLIIHLNCFGLTTFFKDLSQVDKCIEAFCLLGKYGPVVFFVSSGFALTASLSHSHRNFRSFLIQRIFRLWPLYVSILATAVLIEFYLYSKTFTLENLSLRLLFLDMFFPIHFYADPIHVSFSIPIEFWWSLIVFLLYLFLFLN